MGFKADTSFLRFLTMGARATLSVMSELRKAGFDPIELERYATSNKIWSTKIKRLRLPDLLCVRTGLRVEVRAKTSLAIRMSHAPNNSDRHWDAGLREEDVVALVPCRDVDSGPEVAGAAICFGVDALRASVDTKQLSKMKAAQEGSEQYLTWPSIVPNRPGRVLAYGDGRLSVEWSGDGEPARNFTYLLNGKQNYVTAGQPFAAHTMILAASPSGPADLGRYRGQRYQPLEALRSGEMLDRYSAVKALPFRPDLRTAAKAALETMVDREQDARFALEIAGSSASLGMHAGLDHLHGVMWGSTEASMRMEAALIATEVGLRAEQRQQCAALLTEVATDRSRFRGDEVRQAAAWGLGRAGLRRYEVLLQLLGDDEEDVALHAIVGFGPDTSESVVRSLVEMLGQGADRTSAAASEALRIIDGPTVLRLLIESAHRQDGARAWVLATLGRMSAPSVRAALAGTPLLMEIEPLLLVSSGSWLSAETAATSLRFLAKQTL